VLFLRVSTSDEVNALTSELAEFKEKNALLNAQLQEELEKYKKRDIEVKKIEAIRTELEHQLHAVRLENSTKQQLLDQANFALAREQGRLAQLELEVEELRVDSQWPSSSPSPLRSRKNLSAVSSLLASPPSAIATTSRRSLQGVFQDQVAPSAADVARNQQLESLHASICQVMVQLNEQLTGLIYFLFEDRGK
jgi:chromosome segregation ATPase